MYILNALPASVLLGAEGPVDIIKIAPFQASKLAIAAKEMADLVSAVGHADTAALFSSLLGVEIAPNRVRPRSCGKPMAPG